jgi:serine/threonine protein phosphatase PrpC
VKYGGNPKVVIATPDIKCFKIEDNYDFIVLGCDGIFDKLNNMQVIQAAWESSRKNYKDRGQSIHSVCGLSVEKVMKASVLEKTADNITVVVIAFKNFKKCLKNEIDILQGQAHTDSSERQSACTIADAEAVNDGSPQKEEVSLQGANAESGIQISKLLNLPNYDLKLEDIDI